MAEININPYGTGGQAASGLDIVNNCTEGGINKALSAEMGKELNERIDEVEGTCEVPYFHDAPLPRWKDSLKVLFIGNSLTKYGSEYLATILNELNVAADKVTIHDAYSSGRELATWLGVLQTNGTIMELYSWAKTNNQWSRSYRTDRGLRDEVADTPWDVIVFQLNYDSGEYGECVYDYSTFKDTIKSFIYEIRQICPNKHVAFGFEMVYAQNQTRSENVATWESIVKATKELVADSGLFIVPWGTAFMNAVSTNEFKGEDHSFLICDIYGHEAQGVARYITSCTIWESIFAPVFGSMYGLNQIPTYTADGNAFAGSEIPVTSSNIRLCQQAVMAAVSDMWSANKSIDPYDSVIEYIGTTGIQYIDTGIIENTRNIEVTLEVAWTGTDANATEIFFGYMRYLADPQYPHTQIYKSQGKWGFSPANGNVLTNISVDHNKHTLYVTGNESTNKASVSVDNGTATAVTTRADGIASNTIHYYLGGRSEEDGLFNRGSSARFYRLNYKKFADAEHRKLTKEWNFIPVRIGQVGYMFDTIHKVLYGNAGTGAFTLGSDV